MEVLSAVNLLFAGGVENDVAPAISFIISREWHRISWSRLLQWIRYFDLIL